MEQKNKGKKNSVKLTENKKSYTRVEKNKKNDVIVNTKMDKTIKEEIKNEDSHTGIIIVALILALLLALFAYSQIKDANNNEKENGNKQDVIEKQDEESDDKLDKDVEDNDSNEDKSQTLDYQDTITNVITVNKEVEDVIDEEENVEEEEIYYALTFDSNGGDQVETQILTSQEATVSPEIIQKEGWSFGGWYKDETLTEEFIFGGHLQEDVTVYARWTKIVKFVVDGESVAGMIAVGEGEEIPLLTSDDLEEGIVGEDKAIAWMIDSEDENGNIQSSEVVNGTILTGDLSEDIEIVLNLQLLSKFELEFYVDQNSESIHTELVTELRKVSFDGVNAKLMEIDPGIDLTKYGWYYLDEAGNKWNFGLEQVANPAITKLYLDKTYTVIYTEKVEHEDENVFPEYIEIKKEEIVKDSKIEEDNIFVPEDKDGYIFDGWYLVDDNLGETDQKLTEDTIIDGDKVYVGKWSEENASITDDIKEEESNDEPLIEEEIVSDEIVESEEELEQSPESNDDVILSEVVSD